MKRKVGSVGKLNLEIAERDAYKIELAYYTREKERCDSNNCSAQIDHRIEKVEGYIKERAQNIANLSN